MPKKNPKGRWQYSNCILDAREKIDVEFGIANWVPANKFLDPSVSFLNYKHIEFLGGLWSPSKLSCWETWMSFSFWRSQSRYPISRGWKNSNIWSSSKWKHLHCHLFGFLLFSCWMWITQRHPNMSVMAMYTLRKLSPAQVTCAFVALEIKHLLFRFPLNVPVCISHATPCWFFTTSGVKKTCEPFFPKLCITVS